MSIRQKQLNPPLPNSKNKSTDFKGTVHFKTPCAVFLFWGTVQGKQSIGRLPALKNPHTKIKKVGFPLPYFFTQGAKLRHLYNTARKQTHETIHNEQSKKCPSFRKTALQAFLCVVAVASGQQRLRRIYSMREHACTIVSSQHWRSPRKQYVRLRSKRSCA